MSSSQRPPPPAPIDRMTIANLIHSLRSDTCPACGMHCKEPGKSLCPRCYRRLPSRLKAALYLRIEEGYETAMAQSLRRLHRSRFILPDEAPRRVGQLGLLPGPIGTALGRSFRSDLCPKCAGAKRPGRALCSGCRLGLRKAIARAVLFSRPLRLSPAMLKKDPKQLAANLISAIQLLKGKVFHYPQE